MTTAGRGGTLRILVTSEPTDDGWCFTLTCGKDATFEVRRSVPRLPGSPYLPRAEDLCLGEGPVQASGPWEAAEVEEALRTLRRKGGGTASVGHYLFCVLLGSDWRGVVELAERLGADILELALLWSPASATLARLPWELLHDGTTFLATSAADITVTVTRVVAGAGQTMPELPARPRVLFVVGARLTDAALRPGAEMLALLREVRAAGRRIQHRVLDNASAGRMRLAVATYEPHIVHFICHGGETADRVGFLRLQSDERDRETDDYTAGQLLEHLQVDGRLPPIVVLSACDTAGSGVDASRYRSFGGPELAAPLAVDLVRAGVPVVVAMAGTVSDRACRVFTRTFGRALAEGESLVTATADARRLAFADVPGATSVDWALPAVFFGEQVDPDDVHYPPDPDAALLDSWLSGLNLTRTPVFCARESFFETFWSMLPRAEGRLTGWERGGEAVSPGVLAVCVEQSAAGVGKTRLLEELARAALENGHLPLLVATGNNDDPPGTLPELEAALSAAIVTLARRALGLRSPQGGQLRALAAANPRAPEEAVGLHSDVRDLLGPSEEAMAVALQEAVQIDASALLDEARERYPSVFTEQSRMVLLLDNLGAKSAELLKQLVLGKVLSSFGVGTSAQPVPTILTVKYSTEDDIRRQLSETGLDQKWLGVLKLQPFDSATEEDLLAYELVLLHPFRSAGSRNAEQEWVFNRAATPEDWARGTAYFRTYLKGIPANFQQVMFDATVDAGVMASFLLPATDEQDRQKARAVAP